MSYTDPTTTTPAPATRLLSKGDHDADVSAQPASRHGSRTVILRVTESGRKAVYEIPLAEWSRLNRDATRTP